MMKTKIYCLLLALFVPTFLIAEDIPNNEIWYTSTDGKAVQMHRYQGFGANYVSNSYKKGKGVITFDADITSIGDLAFYRCSTLLTITMPPSIISIGNNAFESCTFINNVVIPNSVSSIGDRAFYKCLNMNTISIPETVTSFGGGVFEECDRLPMIDNVRYADKYLVGAATIKYLSSYSILEGTRWIGSGAFKDCTEFTSITIPNSVISIEGSAFYNCSSLASITIPDSVTSIKANAFYNCSSLASITLSNSLIDIGYEAFRGCKSLTRIDIPNSVKSIGGYAFYGCSELSGITMSDSLVDIGVYVFADCNKLPITNNIRYADTYLIRAETKTLSTYSIKEGTKWIGSSAFANCTALTSITIPNTVRSIEESAFASCSQLYEINIPNHLTNIDDGAFSDCYQLDDIVLPNTLTRIGTNAFSTCGLSAIHIPNSVTSIGDWAFKGCGVLTSVNIPNSVTSIGEGVFNNCRSLPSISIPNSVTSIGGHAFAKCTSLTSITIPNSVDTIGWSVFSECTSLASITIPNHVTNIGGNTFYKCKSLTSITIPNAVTSIEEAAFYGCTSLSSIICEALTPPTCGANCFYDVNKTIPLYVSAGNIEAYKAANQWKDFTNIQAITAQVVVVTEIESEPTSTSVEIAWPAVSGSDNYTIEVKQGSKVICTLVFNTQGQLLSINFPTSAPTRGIANAQEAVTTAIGWAYTINGLTPGTAYTYSVVAKNAVGTTIDTKNGSFTTTGATAIENINDNRASSTDNRKLIKNGILLINRNGVYYNAQGAVVE